MTELNVMSRRTFLVAGLAVGTMGILPGLADAASGDALRTLAQGKTFGGIEYIQLHCSAAFSLEQALRTVEAVTKGHALEKVSAAGDQEFEGVPENVLATLYYKKGFRATITSGRSSEASLGTVRGEGGSILIGATGLELLDEAGNHEQSVALTQGGESGTPGSLGYVVRALREGVTVFPEKPGQ